jgi:hypothetical protein
VRICANVREIKIQRDQYAIFAFDCGGDNIIVGTGEILFPNGFSVKTMPEDFRRS